MFVCTTGHVSPEYNTTDVTIHWKNRISTDNVQASEDLMLACLSCWKAPFAAATLCLVSACNVQSVVIMLPKVFELGHHFVFFY